MARITVEDCLEKIDSQLRFSAISWQKKEPHNSTAGEKPLVPRRQ